MYIRHFLTLIFKANSIYGIIITNKNQLGENMLAILFNLLLFTICSNKNQAIPTDLANMPFVSY